jgi:hypothetical protein
MYLRIKIDKAEAQLGSQDFGQATDSVEALIASNEGIRLRGYTLTSERSEWDIELTPAFFMAMLLWAKLPAHLSQWMHWAPGNEGHEVTLVKGGGE